MADDDAGAAAGEADDGMKEVRAAALQSYERLAKLDAAGHSGEGGAVDIAALPEGWEGEAVEALSALVAAGDARRRRAGLTAFADAGGVALCGELLDLGAGALAAGVAAGGGGVAAAPLLHATALTVDALAMWRGAYAYAPGWRAQVEGEAPEPPTDGVAPCRTVRKVAALLRDACGGTTQSHAELAARTLAALSELVCGDACCAAFRAVGGPGLYLDAVALHRLAKEVEVTAPAAPVAQKGRDAAAALAAAVGVRLAGLTVQSVTGGGAAAAAGIAPGAVLRRVGGAAVATKQGAADAYAALMGSGDIRVGFVTPAPPVSLPF